MSPPAYVRHRPFLTIKGFVSGSGITPRKDVSEPMNDQLPAVPAGGPGALRVAAVVAACVGVVALAGAAIVFSYPGLYAVALQARVSPWLARGYPLIFDALLVVVMAAALSLRTAGWPSKLLAWVTLLALVCATAGVDALHAVGHHFPAQAAAVTAAILPWALVLIAFLLLLTMLRHARARRLAAERASLRVFVPDQADPQLSSLIPAQPLVPGFAAPAVLPPAEGTSSEDDNVELAEQPADDDPEMPVFHRAWSTPVPPDEDSQ
jgi:hypothetical protein